MAGRACGWREPASNHFPESDSETEITVALKTGLGETSSMEYRTLSGHRIELERPVGALAEFFERATTAAEDKLITEDELIALLYSAENPLLSPGLVPGRGMVTKETLAHPLYRVLQDLLVRKYLAQRNLDVEAIAARHTLTMVEAAQRLGVHVSAVQQAIKAQRLPSWIKDGRHYLSPNAVDAFELSRRGPKAKGRLLTYRAGNAPGTSYRVKVPASRVLETKGRTVVAEVDEWSRIAVLSGGEGKYRFFELEPVACGSERLEFGGFYVDGPFRVTKKINNPREAREAFKAFVAA
jgi:excisionase family DNA binding protein